MKSARSIPRCALCGMGLIAAMTCSLLTGCAVDRCAPDRPQVNQELHSRTRHQLNLHGTSETTLPPEIDLSDGVATDEAVAAALWNNARFNASLAQLGIARGDLIQAGLLRNPQFQLFLPDGAKQLEFALFLPIDAMLLREQRLDMTQREVCRVSSQLVQTGLDLVRDVQVAHADLTLAVDQAALGAETVELRKRIAVLTEKQLDAGAISELETITARIALRQAEADAAALQHAVAQAETRLRQLMGIGNLDLNMSPVPTEPTGLSQPDVGGLVAEAVSSRPDLRAASFAVAAARDRGDLARNQWFRFDAVADANSGGAGPSNIGPGIRFDIPLFDQNEGGIHSADWATHQAVQNYNAVRDQIISDVETAHSQFVQAEENLRLLRTTVLSSLDEATQLAGRAFAGGGMSYFLVLQTTSQYLDARRREIQLAADLRRAAAQLDRSVGRQVAELGPAQQRASIPTLTLFSRSPRSPLRHSGDLCGKPAAGGQSGGPQAVFASVRNQSNTRPAVQRTSDLQLQIADGGYSSVNTLAVRSEREEFRSAIDGQHSRHALETVPVEHRTSEPRDSDGGFWTPIHGLD